MKGRLWYFLGLILLTLSHSSCKKSGELANDPYAGGKEPLGIRILNALPKPSSGSAGTEVVWQVTGLMPYKDKVKFYMNDTEARIVEITDKTIKIVLPENVSSGGMTIVVDGQIFFGPTFSVSGKVNLDGTFNHNTGAFGGISQIMPLSNGNLMLVGSLGNFANAGTTKQPINGIVLTSPNGAYVPNPAFGFGAGGWLTSVARLPNGQFMVGGGLSSFNKRRSIGGLTRLNANGSLDTTIVEVVNLTPLEPKNSYDTVAAFNGSVLGSVKKVFAYNNKIITVGNFTNYGEYFYERSTRDNKVIGYTKMDMLLRMEANGKLDLSYNYNPATKSSYEGANGQINDALMEDDGRVILVGSFTRFQGANTNRITRIDNNGLVDPSFKTGTGADGPVIAIRYNAVTQKFLVSGTFKNFNGVPANGLVMLNKDGSVDQSFSIGQLEGGNIMFSAQLSNGLIIVSGSFNKYNGVVRQGFMFLKPDGSLAPGYNNTGAFQGIISDIYETTSPLGFPAVLMVGFISKFNNTPVNNMVKIVYIP